MKGEKICCDCFYCPNCAQRFFCFVLWRLCWICVLQYPLDVSFVHKDETYICLRSVMPARGRRRAARNGGVLGGETVVAVVGGGRGRPIRSKKPTAKVAAVSEVPDVVEDVLAAAQVRSRRSRKVTPAPVENQDVVEIVGSVPTAALPQKKNKKRKTVVVTDSDESLSDDDEQSLTHLSASVTSPVTVKDVVESSTDSSRNALIQRRSPGKKASARRPPVSSSSVQGAVGSLVFEADDADVYFYVIGHLSTNKPNEKGAYLAKRFGFCMNKRSIDTIPGAFGRYTPIALKGWGNVRHYSTSAQQVAAMVPGMLYKIKETKKTKFGLIKFIYAPTYAPADFEIMLGDGNLAIPCTTPLSKVDMALTGRTKIASLVSHDHSFNSWYVARLGDKDVLQDNGVSNACTRQVYDESGSSVQLLIWDEECPLALADSGTIVVFWAYVSQKGEHPKKLALISGGVLDLDSFDDQTGYMPFPAPPLIVEHKFLPCITKFNMVGYFQSRPMTGVRILHSIPFVLECLEEDVEYVDFLCPSCAKTLSSGSSVGGVVVHSCTSHGIIEVDMIDFVCHPLCRLSVRLGNTASSESIFVTSAMLAKGQEVIVFGHSCVDICKGADLLPHEGEKFMGTFFIAATGISVDNVRRVNVE